MRLVGWLGLLPLLSSAQSLLQLSSLPLATREDILSLSKSSVLLDTLVPRPVGSKNLTSLQNQYEKRFKDLQWQVERDEFEADTPVGRKSFRNSIFVSDPSKPRTIVLAAHIDSLPSLDGFVGAIDSAAPCAILLDAATALTPWLRSDQSNADTSLTVILFDGEEAFVRWTSKDSIYGAKHLAELWSRPESTPKPHLRSSSRLASINVFILYDLLGATNPSIRSFYRNTHWLFERFQLAQKRLGQAKLLQTKEDFFSQGVYNGHIEDDHLPFLHAGVPILHLIPAPFPPVWHKVTDDINALDQNTVNSWSLLTQLVIAELLNETPRIRDEL